MSSLTSYQEPKNLLDSETRREEIRFSIASITMQLKEKEADCTRETQQWRKKAKWAMACKKEELCRINTWIKRHNRLVDLTLSGKEPLNAVDGNDPNQLLLHTYRLAKELLGKTGSPLQFMEENRLLQAVSSYFFLHPELVKDEMG